MLIALIVVVVLVGVYVVLYNRLVSLRVRGESAWCELEFFEASAGERELPKVTF